MSHDRDVNFNLMQPIYKLAMKNGVSFSCHYDESQDLWYFTVDSPSPRECFTGKDHIFEFAVEDVLEFLKKL